MVALRTTFLEQAYLPAEALYIYHPLMQLGVIGLGIMGANLARNAARNGAQVAVFNRTTEKIDAFMHQFEKEGDFVACHSLEEFRTKLKPPRAILLMVQAGQAVGAVLAELMGVLETKDIVIDGGNSHYKDTLVRVADMETKGIRFLGMGVSGGADGALHGPSLMPGGSKDAYDRLSTLLTSMAADDGAGGKCVSYIGPDGSGHFVKTTHNGIEYAVMQLQAEAYDLLKRAGGMSNAQIADVFNAWNTKGFLRSFLLETAVKVLRLADADTGKDVVEVIRDAAGQKGTGKWTTDAAMTYGVAVPTITAAVDARIISSGKDFRVEQSAKDQLHVGEKAFISDFDFTDAVRSALELSTINAYAQGLQLLSVASQEEKWNLNLPEIIRVWRGGCIIRSDLLPSYQAAFAGDDQASAQIRDRFNSENQMRWRDIIALGANRGIPLPAMSASLSYYDAYRTDHLPQNLTQAQRDYFGEHGFERLDKSGTFHLPYT